MNRIADFIEAMNELGKPTAGRLYESLSAVQLSLNDVGPYLDSPGVHPYGRRRIREISNENIEALVMNWAPGFACAPHDHEQSIGCFLVISGVVREHRFKLSREGNPSVKRLLIHAAGDLVFAPRGLIHLMVNSSDGAAVTLHVYTPPIKRMRVFDPQKCMSCFVKESCGAWWPDSDQIYDAAPWGQQ